MKIVLLENLRKLGSIGDIIEVKKGYARNYLISKKKALFASKNNVSQVEKIKQELNKKDQEKKIHAKNIYDKLNNNQYEISKLCTENKELYGSVKPTEISKILLDKENIEIGPSMIQLKKEIKSLGKYKVLLNLHSEVQANINLTVKSEEENK
tara:strand:+ start:907 stop:1365 length:459 start_codon:yes stop_codon:yes gene_type:complete